MNTLIFRTFPPVACADGQTRRPSPRTSISLHELQDALGWAAIGAKHYGHKALVREFQKRSDDINAKLALMGYGPNDDFSIDA